MTNKYKYFVFFILLSLFSGCSLWRNFTTYFNRYYNTTLEFEDAMVEINKVQHDIFVFKEEPVSSVAKQKLDKVVEKASKILQFDSKSAFFDDALLLIGQSFYYLQEYSKAYRKFQELATIKDSDLLLENKYWLGASQLQLRLFEDGLATLDELKVEALAEDEQDIYFRAFAKQIAYYSYREEYSIAVKQAMELLSNTESEELNAQITYEIGKFYLALEDYENAADYFAKVGDFEPTFEVEFNSKLEVAKLKKVLGDKEKSLVILKEIREENKFRNFWGDIDLEIGLINYEQEDFEKAMNLFTDVDTTYKNTSSAGIAAFMKGEIFGQIYKNYDSSKIFYDKVASSKAPIEYKDKAKKKSEVFKKLLSLRETVNKYTKQLNYILDPELYAQDSLDFYLWKNRDSLVVQEELENAKRNKTKVPVMVAPIKSTISGDSLKKIMAKVEFDYANIFLGELSEPDSAYKYYYRIVSEYPAGQHSAKTYFALGTYFATIGDKKQSDSIYQYVYDTYPKDPIVNVVAQKLGLSEIDFTSDPVEKLYREAEKKYLKKEYKQALNELKFIYHTHGKSFFASKALYTIGFIYENDLKLLDSAAVYYDTLNIKFKNTEFARNINNKLGYFKLTEQRKQAVKDSIAKAKEDSLKAIQMEIERIKLEQHILDSLNNLDKAPKQAVSDSINGLQTGEIIDSTESIQDTSFVEPKDPIEDEPIGAMEIKRKEERIFYNMFIIPKGKFNYYLSKKRELYIVNYS